ncbi:MAG: U-box domain-containing protein [Legionella sp.]|jgi:hypothetical protein
MKNIDHVATNETITHTGDLIIEGDIYEYAKIAIIDGSLIVHGTVHSNVEISVKLSQELKQALQENTSTIMSQNVGSMTITNGALTIRNMSTFIGGVTISGLTIGNGETIGEYISSNIKLGKQIYIGNVRVNNRIFTEDQLTVEGNGNYEITRSTFTTSSSSTGNIAATIDGVRYLAEKKVRIEGKKVWVDGLLKNENPASSPSQPAQASEPKKVVIHGAIHNNVIIRSDAPIETKNIGENCTLDASSANIKAGDIGSLTTITSTESIDAGNISNSCIIKSAHAGLTAKNIGDQVQIETRGAIKLETIGNFCKLTSSQYGIDAGDVGNDTEISVRDAITLDAIGSNSKITSAQYGIKAKKVADNVSICVRDGIQLQSIGNLCAVTSKQFGIEVSESVGSYSAITVRDGIYVGGSIGDHSKLTSNTNSIKIRGSAGNTVIITARDSIQLKNVGHSATVSSTHDSVSIQDIGNNSTVLAKGDININGECPEPDSLSLSTTNRNGKITRPRRKVQAPVQNATNNNSGYATGSYESDLMQAMQESMQQSASPHVTNTNNTPAQSALVQNSLFAPTSTQQEKTSAIPKCFECPLTLEIMKNPVLCILDGQTYERTDITKWLLEHRQSPMNRQSMHKDQTIDQVLIANRSLLDAIIEFKQSHSELFEKAPQIYILECSPKN